MTTLLTIKDLKKSFKLSNKRQLKAVDGLSFTINKGEILGLVGESGCGKSTVGKLITRLYTSTSGSIFFEGRNILDLKPKEIKPFRRKIQMIFQDPYASLNPRMTVKDIIGEALDIHQLAKGKKRKERIEELLELVGLKGKHMSRFPHEFSGGQRQRIGIARAIAVEPQFIVCDEPISALDVSIQAQVVNLLQDLQQKMGLTLLFIAHDLAMVEHIANRVAVMYLGNLMELADSKTLYINPLHPYTQGLLSSIPIADPKEEKKKRYVQLEGDVPSPVCPPKGCPFVTRCPKAFSECTKVKPEFVEIEPEHYVACHLYSKN